MKRVMKFCLCFHKITELWNLFSLVPVGNFFRCYFRQLFMYLALRKCKMTVKYLKLFWYRFLSTKTQNCSIFYRILSWTINLRLEIFTCPATKKLACESRRFYVVWKRTQSGKKWLHQGRTWDKHLKCLKMSQTILFQNLSETIKMLSFCGRTVETIIRDKRSWDLSLISPHK